MPVVMSDALVLIGAVAKGAFTAGALAVLWLEHATVQGAVDVNLRDIVSERGISDASKLLDLLRLQVSPSPTVRQLDLRLVVTNADGEPAEAGGMMGTTFEHVVEITADDFTTEPAIERVYLAAAASAALPVLYAPVPLQVGERNVQGLDGSLLNRTPLGLALQDAPAISRVFVIVPHAKVQREPADLRGRAMVSHVFDMLVHERLFRDGLAVSRVNRVLERLEHVLPDPALRAAVLEAFEWAGRHRVEVVEIRPEAELPGDAFSGFWWRELRETYVRAGVETARRVLG